MPTEYTVVDGRFEDDPEVIFRYADGDPNSPDGGLKRVPQPEQTASGSRQTMPHPDGPRDVSISCTFKGITVQMTVPRRSYERARWFDSTHHPYRDRVLRERIRPAFRASPDFSGNAGEITWGSFTIDGPAAWQPTLQKAA